MVAGGYNEDDTEITEVDVFDVNSETWSTLPPDPNFVPDEKIEVFVHDNKLHVIGKKEHMVFTPDIGWSAESYVPKVLLNVVAFNVM